MIYFIFCTIADPGVDSPRGNPDGGTPTLLEKNHLDSITISKDIVMKKFYNHSSEGCNDECPEDDCHDDHCCHNHHRYVAHSSLQQQFDLQAKSQLAFIDHFYQQPFLESTRKPPKNHQIIS